MTGFNLIIFIKLHIMKLVYFLVFSLLFITNYGWAQIPTNVPTNGLVAYWPFSGNANDESGNGNDGTVNGATLVADRNGNSNAAYYFDGDDYIRVLHDPTINFDITDEYTISVWIKPDVYPGHGMSVLEKWDTCAQYPYQIRFGWVDGFGYNISSGSWAQVNPGNVVSSDNDNYYLDSLGYYNVIVTFSNNYKELYVNGEFVDSNSLVTNNISNTDDLFIGTRNIQPITPDRYFHGIIDDIGIWNRALTHEEIYELYYNATVLQCEGITKNGEDTIASANFISEKGIVTSTAALNKYGSKLHMPSVVTNAVSSIAETSAVSGGDVTNAGTSEIVQRGIVWSTSQNPTIENNEGYKYNDCGAGSYTSELYGLTGGTTYYVRAFSKNCIGVTYGNEVSFTTLSGPCDGMSVLIDIDGNSYNLVEIGDQCWMAENLNVLNDAAGNPITRYCYSNTTSYCDIYGGLYTWGDMMNGEVSSGSNPSGVQGICPVGWHIPSNAEWAELETYLGMSNSGDVDWRGTDQGSKLAGNETLWSDGLLDNNSAFNSAGFYVLPGAGRDSFGSTFGSVNNSAYFWTSKENDGTFAWYRAFNYNKAEIYRHMVSKANAFSVRCVKD